MTLQDKFGILYALHHCTTRPCSNCIAKDYCCTASKRESLWEEIWSEVATLIQESDKAKEEVK